MAALLLLQTPIGALAADPDPRFGIVESYVNPAAAGEAGAGYTRVLLRWDVIQPNGPGDWQPANVPDPIIESEIAAGRQVVGLLIGTPAWAAANGPGTAASVPDMDRWSAFVLGMAQQYRGRIAHWIIWNEPDVWDTAHPGSTWAGTEQDYYRLLKTAYTAIKSVDPSMQVHLAGLTYYWDSQHGREQYLRRLLDVAVQDPEAASNNYYFDGVIYHLYFKPVQTAAILREAAATLAAHGVHGKEIWLNETNAPPSDDAAEPPWSEPRFRVTQEQQAAFVIQQFAMAFANGASRVEFYKLRNTADHPESIEPFGLLRADDSPRPAFAAFRTATSYLSGFTAVHSQQMGEVRAVTFERGVHEGGSLTTTVLWNSARVTARVAVRSAGGEALLVTEQGATESILPENGAYTVELPGAACANQGECFIGGAPRLLVVAGGSPDPEPLMPLPTQTAAAPATTPEPSGGSTRTPTATPEPSAAGTRAATAVSSEPRISPDAMGSVAGPEAAATARSGTAPRRPTPSPQATLELETGGSPPPTDAPVPETAVAVPTSVATPAAGGNSEKTAPPASAVPVAAWAGLSGLAVAFGAFVVLRRRNTGRKAGMS